MNIDFTKSIYGYRLQELLCLKSSCYALGWNPAFAISYTTWKIVGTGQCWDFHTFKTVHEVRRDLLGMRTFSWTITKLNILLYPVNPRLRLYSNGLIQPSDSLIRLSLYQWIYSSKITMNSSREVFPKFDRKIPIS